MSSVPRIFLQETPLAGSTLSLDPALSHYLVKVLRLETKAAFVGFDSQGAEYEMTLLNANAQGADALVLRQTQQAPAESLMIALGQGLPKGSKMDLILRQGTEMGIHQIIPLLTERSVSRPEPSQWEHKKDRWQKILVEACRQCGRRDVPELKAITDWEGLLPSFKDYDLVLLPYEKEAPSLKSVLESNPQSRRILVLIGPEGGWAPGK